MAIKIETGVLKITNYPIVAKHFEEMASQGWLIDSIIYESIFIYKKIVAEELDFAITPYEVETMFTSKSKVELKEFQSVCETIGWNYATRSNDFHIYFKEKGRDATDLETDEEEEFKSIEKIGNKNISINIFASLFIFFSPIFLFIGFFNGVELIREGFIQLMSVLLPLFLVLSIIDVVRTKKFLKVNKKNIELGKAIEYNNSKHYFGKMTYLVALIAVIGMIFYGVYIGLVLKNSQALIAFVPLILGGSIGLMGKIFVKPSKISSGKKVMIFSLSIVAVVIIAFALDKFKIDEKIKAYNKLDPQEYRVLTSDLFEDNEKIFEDYSNKLSKDASLLVPKSYAYAYYGQEDMYIRTEYSNALNKKWAKILVQEYIKQARNQVEQYGWNLGYALQEDDYYAAEKYSGSGPDLFGSDKDFESIGFRLEDFNKIDKTDLDKAEKEALEILKSRAIDKDKDNLWNLDEVYFLSYDKTEVVIREGKEVFYLQGKDFSNPEIIEIVKNKLEL